jgi:HEAT repeat protein
MEHINEQNNSVSANLISKLVTELDEKDGLKRRAIRQKLEQIGSPAVPYLIQALNHPKDYVRWEATKSLIKIRDKRAAPALTKVLMDERFEIQWLAAEALIALGKNAVIPLLEELTRNYGSVFLRQGAHHVLHDLKQKNLLDVRTLRVIDELSNIEPIEPFPILAKYALDTLRNNNQLEETQSGAQVKP